MSTFAPYLVNKFAERRSKAQIEEIIAWVGESKKRADDLIDICLEDKKLGVSGGWVLYHLGERKSYLLEHRIRDCLPTLKEPYHPSIARGILKIIMFAGPLHEEVSGEVVDVLFTKLMDPKQDIAVRALSVEGIYKHAAQYPELMQELKLILTDMAVQEELSAGLRFKCRKYLKILK